MIPTLSRFLHGQAFLKSKGQQPIESPPAKVGANDVRGTSGGAAAIAGLLSSDFRLCQ
jgi:hypothetical protein